jgi:bifunctional DNase/RNase
VEGTGEKTMVEAELFEIRINEVEAEQIIILVENGGERRLPIVIGLCEANAIQIRVHGLIPQRPMTHDLLCNVIRELGGEIRCIVINDLRDSTYYAQVMVQSQLGEIAIDARPSDAVALAVRAECPIYIEDHVFDGTPSEGG